MIKYIDDADNNSIIENDKEINKSIDYYDRAIDYYDRMLNFYDDKLDL